MGQPQEIELDTLRREEIPLAASLAARSLRDNPGTIGVLGADPVRRQRGMEPIFQLVLEEIPAPILVARRDGQIVGLAAMAPPEQCLFQQTVRRRKSFRLGKKQIGFSVPHISLHLIWPLLRLGPSAMQRISLQTEAHVKHELAETHYHVELVAVEPAFRGNGIGTLMMETLGRQIDENPYPAHLETDTEDNVRFYRRLGYEVVGEEEPAGVRFWYMTRPAASQGAIMPASSPPR